MLCELGQERLLFISTNLFPVVINTDHKPQQRAVTVTLSPAESWVSSHHCTAERGSAPQSSSFKFTVSSGPATEALSHPLTGHQGYRGTSYRGNPSVCWSLFQFDWLPKIPQRTNILLKAVVFNLAMGIILSFSKAFQSPLQMLPHSSGSYQVVKG